MNEYLATRIMVNKRTVIIPARKEKSVFSSGVTLGVSATSAYSGVADQLKMDSIILGGLFLFLFCCCIFVCARLFLLAYSLVFVLFCFSASFGVLFSSLGCCIGFWVWFEKELNVVWLGERRGSGRTQGRERI